MSFDTSLNNFKVMARLNTFQVQDKPVRGMRFDIDGALVVCFYTPSASGKTEHEQFLWTVNGAHRDESFVAHLLEQHEADVIINRRCIEQAQGIDLMRGQE